MKILLIKRLGSDKSRKARGTFILKNIAPGSKRIDVQGAPWNVLMSAYRHNNGTLTIVAINLDSNPKTVNIQLAGGLTANTLKTFVSKAPCELNAFDIDQSNFSGCDAPYPDMTIGQSYQLPVESIVTFTTNDSAVCPDGICNGNETLQTCPQDCDRTSPVISNVASSNITQSGATISWTTDEAADSQVEYGLTAGYGQTTTLNSNLLTAHSVLLTGLNADTMYHYRVKSKDAFGNLAVGGDFTLTTLVGGNQQPPLPPILIYRGKE